jgi:hypothetical protein
MTKKAAVYWALVALALLHQDFWFWDDATLVFGFLPVGLAYHALYSVLAGCLWYLALTYAWPSDVESFARTPQQEEKEAKPE